MELLGLDEHSQKTVLIQETTPWNARAAGLCSLQGTVIITVISMRMTERLMQQPKADEGSMTRALVALTERLEQPKKGPLASTNPGPGVNNPWLLRNRELLRRMDRELELTPQQHTNIDLIIGASQERIKVLFRPIAPAMNREMQQVCSEIAKELTPNNAKNLKASPSHAPPSKNAATTAPIHLLPA